jgi:uncharacterized protein
VTWTDDEASKFVRELALPGLVDVHTHFMPPSVLSKVQAYFDAAGPLLGGAGRFSTEATKRRCFGSCAR